MTAMTEGVVVLRVCEVDGCGRKHHARGRCATHRHRSRREMESARIRAKAWYWANRQRALVGSRARSQDARRARARRAYAADPGKVIARTARWKANNRARALKAQRLCHYRATYGDLWQVAMLTHELETLLKEKGKLNAQER